MSSGSGLVIGKVIPVPAVHQQEAVHRRLLAESVNHVAAAAYSPETQLVARSTTLALTGSYADIGVGVTVTPYVPARAHLVLHLVWKNDDGAATLSASFRLTENGTVLQTVSLPVLQPNEEQSYPFQLLRDLEPSRKYAYVVEAQRAAGEAGSVLAPSSLSVRMEPRRLAP